MLQQSLLPNAQRGVVLDGFAGFGIEALGNMAEPNFKEISQLGHRADGRARGFNRVTLLDRD